MNFKQEKKSILLIQIVSQIQWGNEGWIYELLINGFPSVDTFFFMSGVLLAYLSFGEMDKGKFNLPMYYIHRFIRLERISILH